MGTQLRTAQATVDFPDACAPVTSHTADTPSSMHARRARLGSVSTWLEFAAAEPVLAAEARKNLYEIGIGLGFLATVRPDGAPRVHPVCPIVSDAGLHVLVVPGPKQHDLRRDGRYAIHTETCPPPNHEDGCMLTGRAREVTDPGVREAVVEHLRRERQSEELWPSVHTDALFELLVETCLVVRTLDSPDLPAGPTVWKDGQPKAK